MIMKMSSDHQKDTFQLLLCHTECYLLPKNSETRKDFCFAVAEEQVIDILSAENITLTALDSAHSLLADNLEKSNGLGEGTSPVVLIGHIPVPHDRDGLRSESSEQSVEIPVYRWSFSKNLPEAAIQQGVIILLAAIDKPIGLWVESIAEPQTVQEGDLLTLSRDSFSFPIGSTGFAYLFQNKCYYLISAAKLFEQHSIKPLSLPENNIQNQNSLQRPSPAQHQPRLMVFQIQNQENSHRPIRFGISSRQIIEVQPITKIYSGLPSLAGEIGKMVYQNRLIPLLDLNICLHQEPLTIDRQSRCLIVHETHDAEAIAIAFHGNSQFLPLPIPHLESQRELEMQIPFPCKKVEITNQTVILINVADLRNRSGNGNGFRLRT